MSYKRPITYVEGETMFACDICGFPYRYPSEMVRGSDRFFYCRRTCWLGKTAVDDRQERQVSRSVDQASPPEIGSKPPWWD